MASDEEIARQVAQAEEDDRDETTAGATTSEELAEYKAVAGDVHDELARRIESVDERLPDEEDLSDVLDRLDRLETRIEALEEDH